MRRMPVWLILGVALLLTGCGSGVAAHSSPSPTPSPTPTVLSQRQQLVLYLREFKKYANREGALVASEKRLFKTTGGMHQGDDFSAPRARMLKIARKFNALSVDCAAMDPPQCVAGSHKLFVRCLRNAYLADLAYCDYLGTSAKGVSVGQRAVKLTTLAEREYLAWSFSLRVTAKKLHVRIPFHIGET